MEPPSVFVSILPFSALEAALSSVLKDCSETMAKRPQEGDYEEWVVAKSKPVRTLVSKRCAGISTVPSSTASFSPGKFGPEDHEVIIKASTEHPVAQNQEKGPN